MCVRVCVCVYIYMYVCMRVCVYIYACMYVCMYGRMRPMFSKCRILLSPIYVCEFMYLLMVLLSSNGEQDDVI